MKGIDYFVCDIGGHEVRQCLTPLLEMSGEAREIIGAVFAAEWHDLAGPRVYDAANELNASDWLEWRRGVFLERAVILGRAR